MEPIDSQDLKWIPQQGLRKSNELNPLNQIIFFTKEFTQNLAKLTSRW